MRAQTAGHCQATLVSEPGQRELALFRLRRAVDEDVLLGLQETTVPRGPGTVNSARRFSRDTIRHRISLVSKATENAY